MKKTLSLLLALFVLITIFIPYCASAVESSGVKSVQMSTFPTRTQYNKPLTFTVVTDANATKVKVQRSNGNIFALANIDSGFTNYTDNGNQRTWTAYVAR